VIPFDRRSRAGDTSFDLFVARCSTRLLRAAYLLSGDRQVAEDLLQAAMIRTARRWSAAQAAPEAYARKVLINLARDRGRRTRRRVGEVLVGETPLPPGHNDTQHTADHADLVADRDAIQAALAALPERQREVIVLRFYADLSVTETAAAIGTPEGTVMSDTSRALSRLRELLGEAGTGNTSPKREVRT
jgi:RNA polymerase sigma-70 factor (sigma-E family)